MPSLKTLIRIIRNSRRIVIAPHIDPDGDGISAALACAYLVKNYKATRPVLYCHSSLPARYQIILHNWEFTKRFPYFYLLIVVDSAGISRVFPNISQKEIAKLREKAILNIDHHRSNDAFGALQIVDEHASSTCEIVYRLFAKLHLKISKRLAEIFYCGIYSETGGFVYPNTTREVLQMASELVDLGVKPSQLVKKINAKTLGGTLLLSKVLNTIEIINGVGIMHLTQEMLEKSYAQMPDSENFVSFLQAINGVRISMFLREEKGKTRISLRSDGIMDVDKLARRFGGGGHRLAAGLRLATDIKTAKKKILSAILLELKKKHARLDKSRR